MASDALASRRSKFLGGDRKQFDMFFDKMLDGFAYHRIVVDRAGKPVDYVFLEVNHAFERMTGLKRERIIGKRATEALLGIEKDPADLIGVYGRVALTGEPGQFENHDESLGKWFKVSAYCPEKGHFVALFEDITERKKAEAQILEQLHMLDLAHVIVKNMKDEIIFWNSGAQKIYGFSKEEALGKIPRELLKTKFPKPIEQIKEELLLTGKWEGELVHKKADGSYIFVASYWVLHRDNKGEPVAIIEVNNDITERIAVEKSLQESEQRWSTTLASIGDAVIATDVSGKVMFMNSEAEELTGWALSEASQKRVKEVFNIVNEQTRLEVENPIERVLKEGMVVGLANHTVLIRKDGSEVPIDDSGAPIKDKEGKTTGVVLVFRNITERKRQEREIESLAKFPSENPNPIFRVDGKGTILYGNQAGASFLAVWNSKVGECAPEHISKVVTDALAFDKRVEVEETFGAKIFSILFAPVTLEGYVNIYANEITERKKAEEAVRQSERRYRGLYEAVAGGIVAQDQNGSIIEANDMACEILGLTHDQIQGRTSMDPRWHAIHEDNSPFPGDQHPSMLTLKTGKAFRNVVMGVFHPNSGQYRWIIINSEPIINTETKNVQVAVTTFVDITERKKIEEALKESEQRWSTTLASIGDAVIATDVSGRVMFMNSVAEKLTGWTLSETSLKPLKEVFHIINEQTRLDVEDPVNKVLEKGVIVGLANHTVLIRKDGTEVPIDDSGAPIKDEDGKTLGVVLVFRDITERKKLEDSLKESEERFLFALKKTPVTVGNLDRALRFTWVYNPQAGYNPEDLIGKEFGAGMDTENLDSILACMNEVISKGIPTRLEFRGKGLYGEQVFDFYLEPKRSLQNEITGASFIALNITERKKGEEALRKSEEEYSSLFANMIDGFAYCRMIFDEKGKPVDFVYLQVNDAFERITGLKRDAVIGKRVTVAIPGTEKANPELFEIYGRVALTCKEEKFEMFFKPLSKWFSISVYCPQKGYFAGVFEDTTERKQTQNKLEEYANQMERLAEERAKKLNDAERLAAIGATAGMVGHDIRNPLQAITGDLYLAKAELASIPESVEKKNALESLQGIEKNIRP